MIKVTHGDHTVAMTNGAETINGAATTLPHVVMKTPTAVAIEMTEGVVTTEETEAVAERMTGDVAAVEVLPEGEALAGDADAVQAGAIADAVQVLSVSREPAAAAAAAVVTKSAKKEEVLAERRKEALAKKGNGRKVLVKLRKARARKGSGQKVLVKARRARARKGSARRASAVDEAERPLLISKLQLSIIIGVIIQGDFECQ